MRSAAPLHRHPNGRTSLRMAPIRRQALPRASSRVCARVQRVENATIRMCTSCSQSMPGIRLPASPYLIPHKRVFNTVPAALEHITAPSARRTIWFEALRTTLAQIPHFALASRLRQTLQIASSRAHAARVTLGVPPRARSGSQPPARS